MKKTTMKDIAKLANVSVATVSYVLNNAPNQTIPNHTRTLILNAAKELNYVPNLAARSLIKQKSGLIGILINRRNLQPFWKQFNYHSFIEQLEKNLTDAGYHTIIVSIDVADPSLNIIVERKLDAVFLIDINDDIFYNVSSHFVEGIPLILVDSIVQDNLFKQVVYDYKTAIEQASRKIIRKPCLVMESFHNKALLNDIKASSALSPDDIFVVENIDELDYFIMNSTYENIIVINEFIANYLEQSKKFDQIVVICSCNYPEIISNKIDKVIFENNKGLVAFELMEKLIHSTDYSSFEKNKFIIKVSQ